MVWFGFNGVVCCYLDVMEFLLERNLIRGEFLGGVLLCVGDDEYMFIEFNVWDWVFSE